MATRGRPVGSKNKVKSVADAQQLSNDVICLKLDNIEAILKKNQTDIEDLKHQVSMGKGGIKAIFIVGAIVAAIATAIGLYSNVRG